jgi:hypothetical protein
MTETKKKDAEGFRQKLESLKQEPWLGTARSWWTDFLFHYTNITNMVKILSSGKLLSRGEALAQGIEFADSASSEIIQHTSPLLRKHVRFYFRPRTPAFYQIEGIKPKSNSSRQRYSAHCPVPVYLLFDATELLAMSESKFSNGNLAHHDARRFSDAESFDPLPFQLIYHDSELLDETMKRQVIFHRQAEVIIPKEVSLTHLKRIWCRSEAEYETLRYLLPIDIWQKYKDKITARTDQSLFNRRWIYVEKVEMNSKEIVIIFHPCSDSRDVGPFQMRIEIIEQSTGMIYSWEWRRDTLKTREFKESFSLTKLTSPDAYSVKFYIDDDLVYAGSYRSEDDIPF